MPVTSLSRNFEGFHKFSKISGLKPSKLRFEIVGIDTLIDKGVRVIFCSMKCISLTEQTVKIPGIHFLTLKRLKKK